MEVNGWVRAAVKATGAEMVEELWSDRFQFTRNGTGWVITRIGGDCFQLMKEIDGRSVPVLISNLSGVIRKYLSMVA